MTLHCLLIASGLGRRISEIHALSIPTNQLEFEDQLFWVKFYSNLKFLKNEMDRFRNKPFLIFLGNFSNAILSFVLSQDTEVFHSSQENYLGECLYVHPGSFKPLSLGYISCWIKKLVLLSQPGLTDRPSDIRKVALTMALLRNLNR